MSQGYSMLGFVVVVIEYATIGFLAAAGSVFVSRKFLGPKAEQIFYAMFLIMVAGFYLAFTAYFGAATAWRMEVTAVVVFAAFGLAGTRVPLALVLGYPLHGLWDMVHEFQAHGIQSFFEPSQLTAIPLAYGFFCLVYDLCIAGYAYMRRADWSAAWKTRSRGAAV
ncbi:MAG TPA: DUF6010 family protein [Candidatus Limnocylindrales bacterium]|nr:DUF6010 family protein [Candidatus Limnocylindrales bacterium]